MTRTSNAILITGFGPFPGIERNVSAELCEAVAAQARERFPKRQIISATLPTEWRAGPDHLAKLYRAKPAIALHFGVSDKALGFQIETIAYNECVALADAAGRKPLAGTVDKAGASTLAVSLPTDLILKRLKPFAVNAALSADAGRYLCNAVLYESLQLAAASGTKAGFIHIPSDFKCADLNFDEAVNAGLEVVRVGLELPPLR